MAYGAQRFSILAGILMFLAFIASCVSLVSFWWSTDVIPFQVDATLWHVRVSLLGFVEEDMSWDEICDRSGVLKMVTIGDIDGLCQALPALRVSMVVAVLSILVSLGMMVSLCLGASSSVSRKHQDRKHQDDQKISKMKRRYFNIKFIFDVLAFLFGATAAGLGFIVLAHLPANAGEARADAGLFAVCFCAVVTFMIAIVTLVQGMVRVRADADAEPTVWHWGPKQWYGNHGRTSNVANAAVPTPTAIGHDCQAQVQSYNVEMYPQNFNQMTGPYPLPPQPAPSSVCNYGEGHTQIHSYTYNVETYPQNVIQMAGPHPLPPQAAPSCQRPCSGFEQTYLGPLPTLGAGNLCPPHMRVQLPQPQSHPLSMAAAPPPVFGPVQPDFGLDPTSITQVEVTFEQCQTGFYHH